MPKNQFDPEDPFALVGVEIPADSEESMRDMALCFAEEFVRDGWPAPKIMALFKNPFYQGPHAVWKAKGEAYVKAVVDEAAAMWGRSMGEKT